MKILTFDKHRKSITLRLAIISDIHEDILSLKRILLKIEKFGYDHLVCLGDISGFSVPYYSYQSHRSAHDCLSLLREKDSIIIPGNHDFHAAQKLPLDSAIFNFPQNWYELDYMQRKVLSKDQIWLHEEDDLDPLYTHEDSEYLRSLQPYYIFKDADANILFSHYIYPNISGLKKGFFATAEEFSAHFDFMAAHSSQISFSGHSHVNGFYRVSGATYKQFRFRNSNLNDRPVCIGVPAVAGRHKGSGFCIFDTATSEFKAIRD